MYKLTGYFFLFTCLFCTFQLEASIHEGQETIDGIVALVNDEVITLTDVRLVYTFGLVEIENPVSEPLSLSAILNRMIDQKLIIRMTSENITVSVEEIENFVAIISQAMGAKQLQVELENFDLSRTDLMEYVEECLLYKKILSARFDRAVTVSLGEIEAHYNQVYSPAQRAKGEQPQPMIEILTELEAAVKQNKTDESAAEWMDNLRQAADIQIYTGRYPEYFKNKSDRMEGK